MDKQRKVGQKMKKIAIVGPESTGKTQLTRSLARRYNTVWVAEYAREYLEKLDRPYEADDLILIAQGQLDAEKAAGAWANRWLFCDTNLLVIDIWSQVKYGETHPAIVRAMELDSYALHLLTAPDLPWEPDPLREHPHARDELFVQYENALQQAGVPYAVIQGKGDERVQQAIDLIDALA
jgi:NadR type nicotinamide-nucleotide adenylyltransferase